MAYAIDKSLYETIVLNNDIVVLSFNQIADSTLIMSFLNDSTMNDVLINLFEYNRIVISEYNVNGKTISSAVKYIIQQIEKQLNAYYNSKDKNFIFSAINCLNINNIDEKIIILTILKNALMYNDINYLYTTLKSKQKSKELKISDKDINLLEKYVEFLIKISLNKVCFLPYKNNGIFTFTECILVACSALKRNDTKIYNELLSLINLMDNKNQSRSDWIEKYKSYGKYETKIEAIINTCYNLAVESSMNYTTCISNAIDKNQYFLDKYNTILQNYEIHKHQYFSSIQNNDLYSFNDIQRQYWSSAVNILGNKKIINNNCENWQKVIKKYRYKLIFKYLSVLIVTLSTLYLSGYLIDYTLDTISHYVSFSGIILNILAIGFGDAFGHFLNIPNLFEIFSKDNRNNLKTCKKISKHKYYTERI